MSMFDPEYRNALAAFLAQEKAGYDGSPQEVPADYASSAPLSKDPRIEMNANGLMAGIHGIGVAASPGLGWAGVPFGIFNAAMAGKYLGDAGRHSQQLRGTHPDQAQMDEYLRLMQYYGQSPKMGPR